jgi:LCP family protein required for cell wall assembly
VARRAPAGSLGAVSSHDGDAAPGDAAPGAANPGPAGPSSPLPPELNPRGRRAGRAEQRAALGAANDPAPGPRSRRRTTSGRSDVRRGLAIGTSALAALLAVAVLVTSGWAWWTWRGFKSDIRRVDAISGVSQPSKDIDGKDQNILIVGNDDRSTATDAELQQLNTTRDGGSLNTDTMMVLHVPADGRKATVISIPRDSYVSIPGHDKNKINSAYPIGVTSNNGNKSAGAKLAVQTVLALTGLTIDHFVQVDLLGFYRISNAIGGVPVNLCAPAKEANSGINLPAGVSVIKGTQALAFVRQRYGFPDGLGDLDRIKRQQYFLSAAFRKLSSAGVLLNPFKLQDLLKAVSQSLYMDKTLDPLKLAEQMQSLTAGNLSFSTIPTDGFADVDGVGSTVVVNPTEVKAAVAKLVAATTTKPSASASSTAPAVAPSTVTVDVLNGTGTDGVAAQNASALQKVGFRIGAVDTAPSQATKTVVEYPAGMQTQAATVAASVPGATTTQTANVQVVTLILGTDGLHANGVATTAPAAATSAPAARTAAQGGCIY